MPKMNELTFEEAISQLEQIVAKLERDDIPLETAIDLYQKGMSLSKYCDEKLTNAQEKITKILDENDSLTPFNLEED